MGGTVVGVDRGSVRVAFEQRPSDPGGARRQNDGASHRVFVGDKVLVEMTPYDLTKGRIVYRSSKDRMRFAPGDYIDSINARSSSGLRIMVQRFFNSMMP